MPNLSRKRICEYWWNPIALAWVTGCLLFVAPILVPTNKVHAAGFAGGVSPSRFEESAKAGDVLRRSMQIYNLGDRPTNFNISTADWNFDASGALKFDKALSNKSCRPWVKLERHSIKIVPDISRPRSFRFEVHVPEDAQRQECRFAIMLETEGDAYDTSLNNGSLSLPVTGRVAIVVYVAINGAKSELEIQEITPANQQSTDSAQPTVAYLAVSNKGDAHGRLDSDLSAIDADNKKITLTVASSPVLSGHTLSLPIKVVDDTKSWQYPLVIKGKVYSDNGNFSVNATIKKPLSAE